MATISVSSQVFHQIADLAEKTHASVDEEADRLLLEALRRRRERNALVARLRSIAETAPEGVEQTDSVSLLRQDRDR